MPITQQSQIELLEAAQDWRFAFTEYRRLIKSAFESSDIDRLTSLIQRSNYDFLNHPVESERTLARMAEHIRHTRQYNAWRRARRGTASEDPSLLSAAQAAGFTTVAEWKASIFGAHPTQETES